MTLTTMIRPVGLMKAFRMRRMRRNRRRPVRVAAMTRSTGQLVELPVPLEALPPP